MTTRRSFFTRLAQFAAVIAIAPQIAFGRKLRPFEGDYECVIESFTPETTLYSESWVICCPNAPLIIENFSDEA